MGAVGLLAPGPMIGDEVAHFYLLDAIATHLPGLTLTYYIPASWCPSALEHYCNHTFLWHLAGALIYRIVPHVFAVQVYQLLFFLQFLTVFYLFARDLTRRDYYIVSWALLLMWSIPMFLLFGVLFYKDVPVAAQIITVFYLIYRRKYIPSLIFWVVALLVKETAVIMLPALLFYYIWRLRRERIRMYAMVSSCFWLAAGTFIIEGVILMRVLPNTTPLIIEQLQSTFPWLGGGTVVKSSPMTVEGGNCPGNLNVLYNWLIYPGLGFWLGLGMALWGVGIRFCRRRRRRSLWGRTVLSSYGVIALLIALSYIIPATLLLWPDNCDIRYYCPAMPFLIFSFVYWSRGLLHRFKFIFPVVAVVLLVQTGMVFSKIVKMRRLSPEVCEAITFLSEQKHGIPAARIFMYPEGNSRFFPYEAIWTRDNLYFDIMNAENRRRAEIWREHQVAFVVVRKYMESDIAPESPYFGTYPVHFVEDLRNDPRRFPLLLENAQIIVFGICPDDEAEK